MPERIIGKCSICREESVRLELPQDRNTIIGSQQPFVSWCASGHLTVLKNNGEETLVYDFGVEN